MAILTDAKARNLKPDSKPIAHGGIVGLALHSSKTKGRGKWVLRYVSPVSGKRRNAGLGSYPEVGIAEAGKKATAMRELLANGFDPLEEKIKEASQPSIPTFEEAAQIVHQSLLPGWKNKKHGQQWINTLIQYAFPIIGASRLDCIQSKHIAETLRPIWLEKQETASRLKQRIHAVISWGCAHGYCASNPVDVVHHLLPVQQGKTVRVTHHPAMPWKKIPEYLQKHVYSKKQHNVTHACLEFLILTASRSGEVREMEWSEIDFQQKIWTVPAHKMKAGIMHRVPLSKRALEILERQKKQQQEQSENYENLNKHQNLNLVFPSPSKQVALSDMVLTSFLRRTNAPSDVADRVATAHGFRSSFRDWCSEHGYARDLAEKALAHTIQNQVEAAYHRTDLLEQRRSMMEDWAKYIKNIKHGNKYLLSCLTNS